MFRHPRHQKKEGKILMPDGLLFFCSVVWFLGCLIGFRLALDWMFILELR